MDRDDFSEEDYEEYIDFLHDRIQFLEEELRKSEETVLELRQEQKQSNPEAGLEEIIDELEIPEPEDVPSNLSPEDFDGFEDMMLHDPEDILDDPRKAFEEMMNAASQLGEEDDALEKVGRVNDRFHQNNEEWFGNGEGD